MQETLLYKILYISFSDNAWAGFTYFCISNTCYWAVVTEIICKNGSCWTLMWSVSIISNKVDFAASLPLGELV